MSALTSLLARDEVVSVQSIEDALQRQVLEGGDLDTALLELGALPENTLNAYRAASYHAPAASREELMALSDSTLALLPRELAEKYRVVPLGIHQGTLVLVSARPLSPDTERALRAAVGCPVATKIAVEVRVEAALAIFYGVGISTRMRMLAGDLDGIVAGPLPLVAPPSDAEVMHLDGNLLHAFDSEPPPPPETVAARQAFGAPEQQVEDDDDEDVTDEPALREARALDEAASDADAGLEGSDEADFSDLNDEAAAAQRERDEAAAAGSTPGARSVETAAQRGPDKPQAPHDTKPDVARPTLESELSIDLPLPARRGGQVNIAPVVSVAPQPPGVGRMDAPRSAADESVRDSAPTGKRARDVSVSSRAPDRHSPSRPRLRRVSAVPKGPMTARRARELLDTATDRDGIVDIFFSYARQYFDCAVLFAVRTDVVLGLEAHGLSGVGDIDSISVQLAEASALQDVLRSLLPRVAQLSRRPVDAPLPKALGRVDAQPAALIPVCIRQRAVSVLYGDRDGEAFKLEDLGDLLGVLPSVARAFERVIRSRKLFAVQAGRRARSSRPPGAMPSPSYPAGPADGWTGGSRDAEEALAAMALGRAAPPPPKVPVFDSLPARSRLPPGAHLDPDDIANHPTVKLPMQPERLSEHPKITPPERRVPTARASKPPPGAGAYRSVGPGPSEDVGRVPSPAPPAPERKTTRARPGARPSDRSPSRVPPSSRPLPPPRAPASPLHSTPPGAPSRGSYRSQGSQEEVFSAPPGPARPTSRPPAFKPRSRPADGDPEATRPASSRAQRRRDSRSEGPPAPAAEFVRVPDLPRPPPVPSVARDPDPSEPSIIVDIGTDVSGIVDELCRSGPDDEGPIVQSLLNLGDVALPTLAKRFPGPLWFDRQRPYKRLPVARDVSAITRALAAFGQRAVPQVAELLASKDSDVRFYATLLAIELVHPLLLAPLSRAVFDPDGQVRLLVREALPGLRRVDGFAEVVAELRERAGDTRAPVQSRLDALAALHAVRDAASVPLLIELNNHEDKQLAVPAHQALVAITGNDFGRSARKWRAWYKKAADQHRAEWLIDGLTHGAEPVRAVAGVEIQKLSQVYYGYVANAPKRDRERAQARYRTWWEERGRRDLAG